ncbi:hypothetical protein [Aquimarina algiphila]|uniref:Uncharacterized protein n=1 Tax=Aquimarina algiphila TaxID=2047982 RepID=A0A554VA40_9FLAO|nr:hypothetical protein [Aquimarina algiphila]TSE02656.1 hypothetical protein FOF46_30690 [Aquimarina algiphila]
MAQIKPNYPIIKKNITEKLKTNFKNPDSFEFISMTIKKTIPVKERKKTITKEYLDKVKKLNKELDSPELLHQAQTELDYLEKQTDENADAVYYVDFVAKGENSFGGTIQNTYSATVLNDDKYTVLKVK